MLTLYMVALGFGGVLLGTSVLLGGLGGHDVDKDFDLDKDLDLSGDLDLDAEVDAEVDLDGDGDMDHALATNTIDGHGGYGVAWLWLPFLSLRFWSFGGVAFGGMGALLTLVGTGSVLTGFVASASGYVFGAIAAWFFKRIKHDLVTADTQLKRFVGEQAQVVLAVRPDKVGTIRIASLSGDVEVPATTRDRHTLEPGSTVLIASFTGRTADVTKLTQLEHHEAG